MTIFFKVFANFENSKSIENKLVGFEPTSTIEFNKLNFGNGKNLLQKILGSEITKFLISKGEN